MTHVSQKVDYYGKNIDFVSLHVYISLFYSLNAMINYCSSWGHKYSAGGQ